MQEYDLVTCRRTNYIQAAMVQAAIAIHRAHGRHSAIALMRAEEVPLEVIDRVLSADAPRRNSPYTALTRPASLLPDDRRRPVP